MSYGTTNTCIKDLVVTDPPENATPPPDVNDAIREIKYCIKNQSAIITGRTTSLTLDATHSIVICDATGGGFNITLPTISTVCSSAFTKMYIIKKVATDVTSNAITIVGTVDEIVNPTITATGDTRIIIGDGTAWHWVQNALTVMTSGTIDGVEIGGTTPGLMHSKMPDVAATGATTNLTALQCYGTFVTVTYAGAALINLPAAIPGMNLLIYSEVNQTISVDPNGTEYIKVNGTSLGAGYKARSTGSVGNTLVLKGMSGYWIVPGSCDWTGVA